MQTGGAICLATLALLLLSPSGAAFAGDDVIHYTNPFGSDGLNQANLTPAQHDEVAFDEIWHFYLHHRRWVLSPPLRLDGYAAGSPDHSRQIFQEANLLYSMTELRAFVRQKNPDYLNPATSSEVDLVDRTLQSMGLFYVANGGAQALVNFCDRVGPRRVLNGLGPILYLPDGKPRPVPSATASFFK